MLPLFAAISGVLSTVSTLVPKIVELSIKDLKLFVNFLINVLKSFDDLLPGEENVEDVGAKAMKAEEEGVTPEQFDDYDAYRKHLEEMEITEEEKNKYTEDQRMQKGTEVLTGALVQHVGEISADILRYVLQNPERGEAYRWIFEENPDRIRDIGDFLAGKELPMEKAEKITTELYESEKRVHPDTTLDDMFKNVDQARS